MLIRSCEPDKPVIAPAASDVAAAHSAAQRLVKLAHRPYNGPAKESLVYPLPRKQTIGTIERLVTIIGLRRSDDASRTLRRSRRIVRVEPSIGSGNCRSERSLIVFVLERLAVLRELPAMM